jgi:hypothetical protein
MTPHELTAHRACSLGMRAELNVLEANSDHASRVPKHHLQPKSELLTKEYSHSPELAVWSEPCHVPSAQPAALAWRNILF